MSKIQTIYISSSFQNFYTDTKTTNTDAIVVMDTGEKYVAAFFNYNYLDHIRRESMRTGDFLSGKYFWARDMILIDDCSLENIRMVAENLIGEGDFTTAFRLII